MSETKNTSGGFRRITRLAGPTVQVRLFGFMVVAIGGGLVLAWLTHTTWDQLDRLQKEHAAVSSESFYLGVTLRGSIRSLNEKLLQFGHEADPKARADFFRESAELKGWLKTNRQDLAELAKLPLLKQLLIDDFDILDQIEQQYATYQAQEARLLDWTNNNPGPGSFHTRYSQVRAISGPLLHSCDQLVKAQREDFRDFLAETQNTLVNHQRLLKLTLGLIVGLAGAVALLVYRGMIAPLRLSLSHSRTIIQRQEKLASLGVLASGVAHEIRNPLTAIKFRLFSLKKAVPTLGQNEDASVIAEEINRLERIVKDFLRFARPSEPARVKLPAENLAREVQTFLQGQLAATGIDLSLEVQESAWVDADPQQIKQVLINLIQNAAEAVGQKGSIRLRVSQGAAALDQRPQPVTILSVADTGQGIPPEIEPRLFDPFFTTKEGGTGLGLAIAARIVEKHGGMLRYETQLNRGTTFEVVLPRVEHDATQVITH